MGVLVLMFELGRNYSTPPVDSGICMARIAEQGMPFGATLYSEQPAQNWSGQGLMDYHHVHLRCV